MPELRWILLGLGVLFCLGLWWWEARRGRQAADSRAGLNPAEGLNAPTMVRDAPRRPSVEPPIIERELPPWNDVTDEIGQDDALDEGQEDAGAVHERTVGPLAGDDETEDTRAHGEWPPAHGTAPRTQESSRGTRYPGAAWSRATAEPFSDVDADAPPAREPMIDIAAERVQRDGAEPAPRQPTSGWERIEPVIGDAAAAVGRSASTSATSSSATAAQPEKIVTLRVAAPPLERFEGRTLVAALRAAGLEHGKFSIFHKLAVDGSTLFSVASLVEPGTFDLQAIDGRRFPGVSFFAVLSAGHDGSATLEDMLGTARTLAGSLHGMLQDERGTPLTSQRLADLRADVTAWMRRVQ